MYSLLSRFLTALSFPFTGLLLHNSRRVRVLIIANNSILLQRTSIGTQCWSLPGGGIGRRESDAAAAAREVYEEVGLKLASDGIKKIGEDYRAAAGHKRWPTFTRVYMAIELDREIEPRITHPLEILEAAWFPVTELPVNIDQQTVAKALELNS